MKTKEFILAYWKSWHNHDNWEQVRKYMADDMVFDNGFLKLHSADELITIMKKGNPWEHIKLLDVLIDKNKGSIVYEGTDSVTKDSFRVIDVYTIENERITQCISSISKIN